MATNPYTYLIGWSTHNKWYYGCRFAKNCNPNDLWVLYFTSSKKVKHMRQEFGEPDIIQIRKIFPTANKARQWETDVLRKINAVNSPLWLNQTDGTNKFYHEGPREPFTKEHREKLAAAKRGKTISKEHAARLHAGRKASTNSIEHREKTARLNRERIISPETRAKMSTSKLGTPLSEEHKAALRLNQGYKLSPNYKQKQSENMKRIWSERKSSNVD